ncbi:MAG: serine hydrolase [Candidatus Saccharibacteria bacterium]
MNAITNSLLALGLILQSLLGTQGVGGKLSTKLHSLIQTPLPKVQKVTYQSSPKTVIATKKPGSTDYISSASAAEIYDVSSGRVLYGKNTTDKLPMASLTKITTVLTLLQNHHNLDEIITIPDNLPPLQAADQKIGITPGEQFTLRDLLKATLIYSANDAANALAIWDAGSIDNFAEKMNTQASKWELKNSQYKNPTGLDAEGHYSTTEDLVTLSSILLKSPQVREIVNTPKTSITSQAGKTYTLTTTNKDLALPTIYGIKTGQTDLAGECLILLGRNKAGHEIITVVLHSPNRFLESQNMVNYAFNSYIWQ